MFASEENTYTDEVGYLGDFEYWVTAVDLSGNESDPSDVVAIALSIASDYLPDEFALQQNYPNPFNPTTTIEYSLADNVDYMNLSIFDLRGRLVENLFSGF